MRKRLIIFSICAILIVTAVAFLPSLNNDFVNWDDDVNVTENPKIKDLSWGNAKRIFTSRHALDYYKPLTELSYALEYHFFGLNPRPYHVSNLLFHLLNCLLVFWLILLLTEKVGVAFIAALLFGIHPLHVESVAWVNQRKDLLYGFFFLGALISYLFYRKKREIKYYYLSLFLFFISLLPKPQGVVLPLVLLLFDYFSGRKFDRRTFYEKIPFFLLSVVFIAISIGAIGGWPAEDLEGGKLLIPLPNPANAVYGLVFYLVKLAIPVKLSCLYPFRDDPGGVMAPLFSFRLLVIAGLTISVIYSGRYGRKIIFAGLFFLINILLVLQLFSTRPTIAADHYTYIASIGIFYIIGESLNWLYGKKFRSTKIAKSSFFAILAITVFLFSFLTWQRCRVWEDSETLWRDVLKNYPDVPIAHNNLGIALVDQDRIVEAGAHYREALRLKPDYLQAHYNLGIILVELKRFEEAIFHYAEALKLKPVYPEAHNNLGIALSKQGRLEEAGKHYLQALRLKPDYAEAHYNLGIDLDEAGKPGEAIFHLSEALRIDPDYEEAHNNLGYLLARQGKFEEALEHFNEALRIKPNFPEALRNRRLALEKMKEREQGGGTTGE